MHYAYLEILRLINGIHKIVITKTFDDLLEISRKSFNSNHKELAMKEDEISEQ